MRLFLWPGDVIASMAGLPEGSDNRQILRMWANTVVWGTLSAIILVLVLA
jgi:hypothetical protein